MYILGISCFMSDASAALIKDGELIAAAEEERFTREKHDGDFPANAIDFCLKVTGITYKDIDYVGFYFKAWHNFHKRMFSVIQNMPHSLIVSAVKGNRWFSMLAIKHYLARHFKIRVREFPFKFIFVEHHLAHAASSFFVSPFEESAILTMDECGEYESILFSHGKRNKIAKIHSIGHPHAIGVLYRYVTNYLGFPKIGQEGKVMGLAPYGRPGITLDKVVSKKDAEGFRLNMDYFSYYRGVSRKFIKEFGPARAPDAPLEKRHEDIAYALQNLTEEITLGFADYLYKVTNSKNLCLGGGVALNCVMNGRLLAESPFKNIYVQPAAGDAGGSIGAAFYIHSHILGNNRGFVMRHTALGPQYSEQEIRQMLDANGAKYEHCQDIAQAAAGLLASGKIVGWFQGRMEFGPRALGNRSILADPRIKEMKDILNKKVKHRESFRPFAPSVLKEDKDIYFERITDSPFMLLTFLVRYEARQVIPAVTHVDNSARVQTVDRDVCPEYWELINNFKKITGVGVLLDTSFNVKGEPIVCSPSDAYKCYLKTGIDCLVLENFLLVKDHIKQ